MTSPVGNRCRGDGFTLLELLVVLVILGATMAMAVPMFARAWPAIELKATARSVAAALREARGLAITGNREMVLAVDLDRRMVDLAGREKTTISGDIGISLYTAAEESIHAGIGSIRFYPDGTSTGGRIRLSDGGRRYDVIVDWISGNVTVHE